jgi:hypothetical protein
VHNFHFNPFRPDFWTFPSARSVRAYHGIVHPGDVLVFPVRSLHTVRSLDQGVNVGITVW